jgi:hypothetical protein
VRQFMKLFKSLLVAPATLGLLAPMTATANELNLNDVSGYSSSEEVQNISEFNSAEELAVTNSRVDGLEARFNNFEAGGFSDTTTASFGATFALESTDGNSTTEATMFSYQFGMDLSTSFTGEDSLDLTIETGNAVGPNYLGLNGPSSFTADVMQVDGIAYTFPLGDSATFTVGEGVDASGNFSTACTYSALLDQLGDCGTANSAGAGGDIGVAMGYDFGNGFTFGAGISATDGAGTKGILTKEGADVYALQAAYATDSYGVSLSYADNDTDTFWGLNASYTFEDTSFPTISVGYETQDVAAGGEKDQIFVGLTFPEVGAGSVSVGMNTVALTADSDPDYYYYEASYSYPLNDGMTITPGVFIKEGTTDETGVVVSTSFSF